MKEQLEMEYQICRIYASEVKDIVVFWVTTPCSMV
jgi:hypothetical protein